MVAEQQDSGPDNVLGNLKPRIFKKAFGLET